MPHPEIGRELLHGELAKGTIYALIADHAPNAAMTLWYAGTMEGVALFEAKLLDTVLMLTPNETGELFDGLFEARRRRIRVYEYLGKP